MKSVSVLLTLFPKFARWATTMFITLMIASCGGGGGSPGVVGGGSSGGNSGGSTTSSQSPTLTLQLVDSSGANSTAVTTSNPLTVRATVLDGTGSPVPDTIVTFSTDAQLTILTPSVGTRATDSSGVATITLSPKDLATAQAQTGAAGTVSAAATVGTQAAVGTTTFTMGATAITLNLVTPASGTINLTAYDTTPISVEVRSNGSVYTAQPVTINFSSACASANKASLPGTASTVNGRAQVVYVDKGCGGTDTVTASVVGAQPVTATLVVAAPVASSMKFVSAEPSDKAIVIAGAGGNGRTETAQLTFQALDTFGNPLPNQLVNFTVNSSNPVTLVTQSATTDSDGKVVAVVNSGSLPTTFRVNATLSGGQSTLSDTITVTTGQPVQAAFSLSAESFNIEGWSHDNTQTNVNILLADASGNPVADGTPVVFQTDSGAIGSSNNGGCITTNGGCSVVFRSQNPRFGLGNSAGKRAGLATIDVSTTSALVTLSGQIGIFLSGSSASNVYLAGTNTKLNSNAVTALSTTQCGNFSLNLELNDVNFNPMPVGTAVTSANADGVTVGEIIPGTVPNIFPHDNNGDSTLVVDSLATRQGSIHTIPIKPDTTKCNSAGAGTSTGTFDVKIETPLGTAILYSFSLSYPS